MVGTCVAGLECSSRCYTKKVLLPYELDCDVAYYAENRSTVTGAKTEIMTISDEECHSASVESYLMSLLDDVVS
jgi:hypothetical protein